MNIITVLGRLGELETSLAELYERYTEAFEADPEVSDVFARMGVEERGHARLVEYQRRVLQRSPAHSMDVAIDLKEVEAVLARAKELRASPGPPAADAAIREALEMETSAAEGYYREALKQADPQMAKMLESLAGKDNAHLKRILDLALRRQVPIPSIASR